MTKTLQEGFEQIAIRRRTAPHGIACIASTMGPRGTRGCVPGATLYEVPTRRRRMGARLIPAEFSLI